MAQTESRWVHFLQDRRDIAIVSASFRFQNCAARPIWIRKFRNTMTQDSKIARHVPLPWPESHCNICAQTSSANLVMSAPIIVVPALSSSCRRNPLSSPLPYVDQPVEQGSVALQGVARPVVDDASAVHDHRARGNVEREPRVL